MSLPVITKDLTITEIRMVSPIKNLDSVLYFLANHVPKKAGSTEIMIGLKARKVVVTDNELNLILNKLSKDEFITIKQAFTNSPIVFILYSITFEGLVFYQQGGYAAQIRKDSLQRKTQKILFWFTGIVAVGTLIAAFYYSIEIWKFYCGK